MRNHPAIHTTLGLAIAGGIAIVAACSGQTVTATGDGGSMQDATITNDAAPLPPDCPPTMPAEGTGCTKDQLICEYGDDFDPQCNTIRVCSGGKWASSISFGGPAMCPSGLPTIPQNPTECAATRTQVPEGTACTGSTSCAYDGSTCFCGRFCPSYPIRQPDCDPDAGITMGCCNAQVVWNCFDGPAFCPTPRPRVGTACTTEGASCAVSAPAECGQATLQCKMGVWALNAYGCPISSARFKQDITYVDDATEEQIRRELLDVKLATYRYKQGDEARHLGFIIEDMPPGSAAVLPTRDRVDLYGYVSMAVATLQEQQKEIDALKSEVARLKKSGAK
jgi:hypothetical protein